MPLSLHHVNIRTANLEQTVAFFTEAIGLKAGWRPDFGFPGAWLYDSARPVVHLNLVDQAPRNDSVSVDHVAFAFDALDEVLARLDRLNLRYTQPKLVSGTNVRQCFTEDPNGVIVELQGP
jgi:catechol 2,3-dioxygenase-like lactoylglutathione lyase family enzyme